MGGRGGHGCLNVGNRWRVYEGVTMGRETC